MLILKQLLLFVNLDKEGVRDRLVMDIGKKRRRTFSMKHDIFVTPPPGQTQTQIMTRGHQGIFSSAGLVKKILAR